MAIRQALIAALSEGLIDVIATDHAPHRSIDKDCTYDEAAFGISGFDARTDVERTRGESFVHGTAIEDKEGVNENSVEQGRSLNR